ncbi:hypothetical protein MBS04_000774 [Klebsiella pneumoniae]|uniref:Peptidase n=4 Tax=Bacteria TaxID=2 RepID=A0AAX1KRB9_KLEPN|nr:hypothetical protein [Klebsiella pneumoniae]AKS00991.1 hypothetical protein H222_16780 [Klebsiella pneumoniae UHKPC33]AID97303.1 hypothetical protein KPNIH24_19210 [Klebsiella pneumoniae subsp. pneumoniae KPNIH24]AIE27860.1 hypothetical protein KPR0928_09490 [Klebsiella pneumoniae subsp. pneumoniae KPR0928]AIX78515.1 hypothetical protein KPNIH30_09835 [Klebsiella pneumoniae subsp. pneumoniae]AJB58368.1 hypothetical protein KU54_016825 [Klebsiella pneumoniae]
MNLFERLILRRLMNVAGEGGEGGAPATGNEEQQQGQQEQQTPASLLNSGEPAGQQQGQQPQQQGQQQAPAAFIEKLPDDGDEKGWQDLYAKLGRPEKIEDYGIKPPEGSDGTFLNTALGWMHESGLNKKQAENVINKFNEYAAEQQKSAQENIANQNAANREKVIKSWGSEVEANTAILQHAVQRFFPDAVIEKFSTAGLLNDPDLVNAVLAIGKALGEDKTVTVAAPGNAAEKDIAHRMWPNMQ